MSRIVRIWAQPHTPPSLRLRKSKYLGIPLYAALGVDPAIIGWIPPGGVLSYFVAFYDNPHSEQVWMKVIHEDQAGWIWLGNVLKIDELEQLPSGEVVETQVYPNHDEEEAKG